MSVDRKGKEKILQMVARPTIRSSLFWWLLENHDDLVEAEVMSGLGMRWTELCVQFTELGLADRNGNKIAERTAKKTWERVRKERARLDARRVKEEAARVARRAVDPRRNMPSRITGPVGPALAEVQTELPAGATRWNDLYYKDREGWIQPVQQNVREYINVAGAARNTQESNRLVGRPMDNGIEKRVGPRKEYGA
jgi:hypothetical protein